MTRLKFLLLKIYFKFKYFKFVASKINIPKGMYCYTSVYKGLDRRVISCPYYRTRCLGGVCMNWCIYLKVGDDILLDDMVKICEENE